ncbi:D-alanyl-D-alanine carboxypeptidase family protein [Nodosilinea sp. LEGE 07088]|uniref:M15 family metallopeptidase n=1 Tax=Nodosilinea sp. LEGE 07088 TaxID=2777968 RepID=UPI00187DF680|nr:M15 family metallopeptidase [Nodosilinea sp. LEGE 07088]MBE9139032.1 D-alanyl-D-alanine carboxypeptidase family protein [Nodosilinea sp. LEGE 07088]
MPPLDDIPQAARDVPLYAAEQASPSWLRRAAVFTGLTLLALTAGGSVAWYQTTRYSTAEFNQPFEAMVNPPGGDEAEPEATDLDRAVQLAPSGRKLLLGHRAFDEAPAEELVALAANPSIRLRATAAAQFEAMAGAAAQDGIRLVPLSGFRSHGEQEAIFFKLKAERGQDPETRAEVSAPPGYSEHHTGYAIDVGDATQPGTHLNTDFGNTAAYQWMEANAVRFGYELSFPPDNFQGVAFEPWHWRFVGDRNSLETFYSE